jgi:membrane associated rhomboid family serine protease
MTSTVVGMRCPECAGRRARAGRVGRRAPSVRIGRSEEPVVTYVLLAVNTLAFVASFASGQNAVGGGFGGSSLLADGALTRHAVADGDWWRLLTSGFLHAGFLHLLFNMLGLWVLGSMLEPAIGHLRFALIYFVSLLCGSFGVVLLSPSSAITIGASGAIFGLLGAAFVILSHRGLDPMQSGLGMWLLLNLLITFTVPHISIGGHVGGLIGGSVAALVLFPLPGRVRLPAAVPLALAAALGCVAVAGSIAVAGAG